jgi:hypothetical protein
MSHVKNVAVLEGDLTQVQQIKPRSRLHTSLVTLLMHNLQAHAPATVTCDRGRVSLLAFPSRGLLPLVIADR